jgi:hypothetical protein
MVKAFLVRFVACVASGLIVSQTGCADQVRMTGFSTRFSETGSDAFPHGWTTTATNPGDGTARWAVQEDATALSTPWVIAAAESSRRGGAFNLAVADDTRFDDLELTVHVKAVSGREDQGGGPVWRYQDADNYYICRLNPLEGNFRVYVVASGKRRQLDSADVALAANRWYEIRVRMVGNAVTCSLDGRELLHATDETIRRAGAIGLWAKADAVTEFDDLHAKAIDVP